MPPEGFDGIGRLFYDCGDGEYVPLMDVKEESIVREEKPFTAEQLEQLKEAVQELEARAREASTMDTALMNDEIMMILMANGYIREEGKELWYCGLRVITSPYLPMDQVYLTTSEHAKKIIWQFLPKTETAEVPEGKKDPKRYHCRVCGRLYTDKADAKDCVRSHEWQNRRGRR